MHKMAAREARTARDRLALSKLTRSEFTRFEITRSQLIGTPPAQAAIALNGITAARGGWFTARSRGEPTILCIHSNGNHPTVARSIPYFRHAGPGSGPGINSVMPSKDGTHDQFQRNR